MSDAIDTTAEEIGTDLEPVQHAGNLFRTDDPVEVLDRASRVADALKDVIVRQRLVSNIQGREHVRVEGWTTLGSMLGVVPVVTWTKRTEDGWEARVEARTLDGRVVGAAEAMCSKGERTWKSRDDYAIRSMAQTRATSKALRGPLGFVVTLAGFEATPAEEMPREGFDDSADREQSGSRPATKKQLTYLKRLVTMAKNSGMKQPTLRIILDQAGAQSVAIEDGWMERLSSAQVSSLIDVLKEGVFPTGESDVPADAPEKPAERHGDDLPWEPETKAA